MPTPTQLGKAAANVYRYHTGARKKLVNPAKFSFKDDDATIQEKDAAVLGRLLTIARAASQK